VARRKLILTLLDDQKYKFSTLSRRQIAAFLNQGKSASTKKMVELERKMETEGLNESELEEFEKCQEEAMSMTDQVIRQSISKDHPEFAITNDPEIEKQRNEALSDLIDVRDTQTIMQFAMKGVVIREKQQELEPEKDIEL